jgi:hypothetical protein
MADDRPEPDAVTKWAQESHDTAAWQIMEIASQFGLKQALGVLDLARARLTIRRAIHEDVKAQGTAQET